MCNRSLGDEEDIMPSAVDARIASWGTCGQPALDSCGLSEGSRARGDTGAWKDLDPMYHPRPKSGNPCNSNHWPLLPGYQLMS